MKNSTAIIIGFSILALSTIAIAKRTLLPGLFGPEATPEAVHRFEVEKATKYMTEKVEYCKNYCEMGGLKFAAIIRLQSGVVGCMCQLP